MGRVGWWCRCGGWCCVRSRRVVWPARMPARVRGCSSRTGSRPVPVRSACGAGAGGWAVIGEAGELAAALGAARYPGLGELAAAAVAGGAVVPAAVAVLVTAPPGGGARGCGGRGGGAGARAGAGVAGRGPAGAGAAGGGDERGGCGGGRGPGGGSGCRGGAGPCPVRPNRRIPGGWCWPMSTSWPDAGRGGGAGARAGQRRSLRWRCGAGGCWPGGWSRWPAPPRFRPGAGASGLRGWAGPSGWGGADHGGTGVLGALVARHLAALRGQAQVGWCWPAGPVRRQRVRRGWPPGWPGGAPGRLVAACDAADRGALAGLLGLAGARAGAADRGDPRGRGARRRGHRVADGPARVRAWCGRRRSRRGICMS